MLWRIQKRLLEFIWRNSMKSKHWCDRCQKEVDEETTPLVYGSKEARICNECGYSLVKWINKKEE